MWSIKYKSQHQPTGEIDKREKMFLKKLRCFNIFLFKVYANTDFK